MAYFGISSTILLFGQNIGIGFWIDPNILVQYPIWSNIFGYWTRTLESVQNPVSMFCPNRLFISSNLVLYRTRKLQQGTVTSSNNVTNWVGTIWIAPILGTYIADAHLGRYWTFVISSCIYLLKSEVAEKFQHCLGSELQKNRGSGLLLQIDRRRKIRGFGGDLGVAREEATPLLVDLPSPPWKKKTATKVSSKPRFLLQKTSPDRTKKPTSPPLPHSSSPIGITAAVARSRPLPLAADRCHPACAAPSPKRKKEGNSCLYRF
ncbi:protein NRT1/ PTR FAMILY 5.2-like protein [Cinnamomum micranthum f. kanehirae]|uniref:Protein NRT1/ PTR FAMILY 5.2-like protein n=1 Tax=Cinnamomum micranthum f. kanehirae TaxID=337451 RepID=A0A443Q3N7_9MAGN|nr:protein NRT1/ PTR FAMILY 5.2-like protein [Cinnamomum micranthum f. kanehirae]